MNQNTQLVTAQVAAALRSPDMQAQMGKMLPPNVNLDKFTEVTIAAVENSPDVLEADRDSLYRACVAAARRGLLPDKKEGALVIYNTNVGTKDRPAWMKLVQFLPMVEGILKEMSKAGIKAYAVAVYENDSISFWNDDEGQHVRHEPMVFGERGAMVGVFAAAKTEDGRPYVEAMSIADIEQVARRSKQCSVNQQSGKLIYNGTWKSDFDRMAQKSALHRLRKRLPITDEDALQNLKDMEETTDIELDAARPPATTGTVAPAQASSPPPAQTSSANGQAALPAPDHSADEVLTPTKIRTPRKSKVLEGVKAANSSTASVAQTDGRNYHAPPGTGRATPSGGDAGSNPAGSHQDTQAKAPEQEKKADTPAPAPAEPEYSDDDII